jgi:hypothetical protein
LAFVYRAAKKKSWIENGVHEDAFRRRADLIPGTAERRDELGISVSETPQGAAAALNRCHGMIRIDTDKLRENGYTLVPDDDHFSIPEPPFDIEENRPQVLAHAAKLRECSEVIPWP